MLQRTEQVIDQVMAKVVSLGGVVSGEHGIGVTKLKYLEPERIQELSAHRREVDPGALMNPGKLEDVDVLDRVFTPSFNLLELEARILQHGQLEELARSIAHCVRCGKCKPDCCVYHPARGMFFHPRNKNLAIGVAHRGAALRRPARAEHHLRAAALARGGGRPLHHLPQVPEALPGGHRHRRGLGAGARDPERLGLQAEHRRHPGHARLPREPVAHLQQALPRGGGPAGRRGAARGLRALGADPAGRGRAAHLPAPAAPLAGGGGAAETLRDVIPECEPDQVLVFEPAGEAERTVFYFPGCGSERLQSRISMAALHVLGALGTRVILPPPFLCCGFPMHVNAKTDMYSRTVLRDTILFSQIREMFSYLDFDGCVVTCGTCREGLEAMEAGKLFGGRTVDVARYALERGLKLPGAEERLPLPRPLPRLARRARRRRCW